MNGRYLRKWVAWSQPSRMSGKSGGYRTNDTERKRIPFEVDGANPRVTRLSGRSAKACSVSSPAFAGWIMLRG